MLKPPRRPLAHLCGAAVRPRSRPTCVGVTFFQLSHFRQESNYEHRVPDLLVKDLLGVLVADAYLPPSQLQREKAGQLKSGPNLHALCRGPVTTSGNRGGPELPHFSLQVRPHWPLLGRHHSDTFKERAAASTTPVTIGNRLNTIDSPGPPGRCFANNAGPGNADHDVQAECYRRGRAFPTRSRKPDFNFLTPYLPPQGKRGRIGTPTGFIQRILAILSMPHYSRCQTPNHSMPIPWSATLTMGAANHWLHARSYMARTQPWRAHLDIVL